MHRAKRVEYLLFLMVFSLLPVYLFSGGGVQVSDLPISVCIFYIIATYARGDIEIDSLMYITFFLFVSWAVLVNTVYFLDDLSTEHIRPSLQLLYTSIFFFAFTILFSRILSNRRSIYYVYVSILISILMPLITSGKPEAGMAARSSLSFYNPNQLAYFALSMIAVIFVLNNYYLSTERTRKELTIIVSVNIIVIVLTHYYVVLSASTGALACAVALDMLMLFKWFRRYLVKRLLLSALIATLIAMGLLYSGGIDITGTKMFKRVINRDLSASLEKRHKARNDLEAGTAHSYEGGTVRILFGTGKITEELGKEVHNTFLDVAHSYGLMGLYFFLFFLVVYFRACMYDRWHIAVLMILLPLHMSHNLIRFRSLWILYALVYSISILSSVKSVGLACNSGRMVGYYRNAIRNGCR